MTDTSLGAIVVKEDKSLKIPPVHYNLGLLTVDWQLGSRGCSEQFNIKQQAKRKMMKKNNSFVYHVHHCSNPDSIQIQARVRFPKVNNKDLTLDFECVTTDPIRAKLQHPFYSQLAGIDGLKSASGGSCNLQIWKVNILFTWDELLPQILKAIQDHFADGADMVAYMADSANSGLPEVSSDTGS